MDKNKLQIMWKVVDGYQSVHWAAARLQKSERTIKRYAARLRLNPDDDLIHKNRGKTPANKTDHEKIWKLYLSKYRKLNISFFCEKIEKDEGMKISEGLVRLIFKEHDEFSVQAWHRTRNELRKQLREKKKLTKQQKETLVQLEAEPYFRTTHPTQPRSKYFGEELQMDASIHLWFGNRKCALHTAIDDASGMIVGAYFDWQETRNGYYQITRQFLTNYGIPARIKTDKRTVFEYKKKTHKDMTEDTMTQYQLVCQTLGIDLLCCSEPQFKARVERSYRTLQGRLPFELRQAGVTTLEQANEFLNSYIKKFNEQFAICDGIENAWDAQVTEEQIDKALVTIALRTVDCGNGIRIYNRYYGTFDAYGTQVFIKPKTKVSVFTMMNGSVYALHNDRLLAMEEIPERQKISDFMDWNMDKPVARKKYIPPFDSIWRITNSNFFKKQTYFF